MMSSSSTSNPLSNTVHLVATELVCLSFLSRFTNFPCRYYIVVSISLAHQSSVVGVHVTSVNRLAITIGVSEVKFWSFSDCQLIDDSLTLESTLRFSKFHDER